LRPKLKTNLIILKKIATVSTIIFSLLIPAIPIQFASATTTIEWRLSGSTATFVPLNQGDVFGTDFVTVHVEDTDLIGNGIDSINVQLTSTVDSAGITITLTEASDNGIFDSGRIVLMQGTDRFTTGDTAIVTIEDSTCGGTCDPNNPDILTGGTDGFSVSSDTDSATGILVDLTETGDDTKIFTGTFQFITGGASSGTSLLVSPGDVITYFGDVDFELQNAFIIPGAANEGAISAVSPGVGTIPASTFFVTASYNSQSASLEVTDDGAGGRGSGGLVRPGVVVDSPSNEEGSESGGGNNGGGCSGDCSAPTLGINEKFRRVVDNGFTYNGNTINVERYFTPYPLITVDVGVQNKAVFKIYENLGPDNIWHFDLVFGLATGQIMGTSDVVISWNKSHDGTETVTLVDPHNALDYVRVLTSKGKCKTDSNTSDCLIVTVFHTFREPLESDMVGTNVWDYRRNAWQNFYNHGIHIEGESLNPPDEYVGIHEANLIHIFETGKNTAIDEAGNTWTFDKIWTMDYILKGKIDDGITMHGIDRNNARFDVYKQGQILLAKQKLQELLGVETIENDLNGNGFETIMSDIKSPGENRKLQISKLNEVIKAIKLFETLFEVKHNFYN